MRRVVHFGSGLVGLGIIGCVGHAAVMSSGGYASTAAPLLIALAGGLAMGAVAVGVAWGDQRYVMAGLLGLALLAGEAYALLLTSERTLDQRELKQAPLRAARAEYESAARRVSEAAGAVLQFKATSPRLEAANATKSTADGVVAAKSAERGCLTNCRALLQSQVDAAAAEVAQARAEIDGRRRDAEAELAAARAALGDMKAPVSDSPLADRLGLSGWTIDLLAASLASLAANGLGAFLLAFAVHGRQEASPIAPPVQRDAVAEANKFACAHFRPARNANVRLVDVRDRYRTWCCEANVEPLSDREIGCALAALFERVGLFRRGSGTAAAIPGIQWKDDLNVVSFGEDSSRLLTTHRHHQR